jgi:hypothetical protein
MFCSVVAGKTLDVFIFFRQKNVVLFGRGTEPDKETNTVSL